MPINLPGLHHRLNLNLYKFQNLHYYQIRNQLINFRKMFHGINYCITVFLMVLGSESVWVAYTRFTGVIPTYVYPLNLSAGTQLYVKLSWANNIYDLDLYLYPQNVDLLARSNFLIRCFSNASNPENLYYNITAQQTYYLRPDIFQGASSPYKLEIFINGQLVKIDQSTLYDVSSGVGNFNFQITSACAANIVYDGPVYNISLYQPGAVIYSSNPIVSNTTNINPKILASSLSQPGIWSVIIHHNITSTFSTTPFTITVQTQKGVDQCINYCSNIPNTMGLVPGTTSTCFCATGYQWVGASSTCQVICSPGYIFNATTNICQFEPCGISYCSNCPISVTICLDCNLGFQLINNTCQTVCGDYIVAGYQLCDDGNNIDGDGCSMNCRLECSPGYYLNSMTNICEACKYTCTTCSDGLTCDTCSAFNYRVFNFSQCNPISGYYDSSVAIAVPCIDPCSTCISSSTCITCISGYYFDGFNCLSIIQSTPSNSSIISSINESTVQKNDMTDMISFFGKTLSFSQIRVLPNVLRCFSLILDDLWYYRFHRVTYPETARIFMDKVDIINDLRLSPWLLESISYLQFNQIDLGSNYQLEYNQLISQHQNNPDSIYFINSSQDILFGNFITNIAYFALIKLAQLALYRLRNNHAFVKKLFILLRNSNRWWTIITILIQANLAKLVFNCTLQFLILSSLSYQNKLNMAFSTIMLFSAIIYSCCFYPIIYYFERKKAAQTLLTHARYTWRGFYIQSFCFMARTTTRGFIHGFLIQSFEYQILCLLISDLFFAGICMNFRRSFYHKMLLWSIIIYNLVFFALDAIFYLHYLRDENFFCLDYEQMAFWTICAIFVASLLIIFSIIGFNLYILCCKKKDKAIDEIKIVNVNYKPNLEKKIAIKIRLSPRIIQLHQKKKKQEQSPKKLKAIKVKKTKQGKPINFNQSKEPHILKKINNLFDLQSHKAYATKAKQNKAKNIQKQYKLMITLLNIIVNNFILVNQALHEPDLESQSYC